TTPSGPEGGESARLGFFSFQLPSNVRTNGILRRISHLSPGQTMLLRAQANIGEEIGGCTLRSVGLELYIALAPHPFSSSLAATAFSILESAGVDGLIFGLKDLIVNFEVIDANI